MRVLVTGGLGFIGSHLCRRILDAGHELTVIDPLKNYRRVSSAEYTDNLAQRMALLPRSFSRAELVLGEGRTRELRDFLIKFAPTHIVHLAANPLADLVACDPETGRRDIVGSTEELLATLADVPSVERLVLISSSMVYGDFSSARAKEDDVLRPSNEYGILKLEAENLVRSECAKGRRDFVILRPTAVYGPYDNNARVVQKMILSALEGREIVVRGANDRLDFTHVHDVADGIYLALAMSEARNQIFNIAFGESHSLADLAKLIAHHIPKARVGLHERDSRLPRRGSLDIQNAREVLGFDPKITLRNGVDQYVDFLRGQREDLLTSGHAEQVQGESVFLSTKTN